MYTPVSIPKTSNGGRTKPKAAIYVGRLCDVATGTFAPGDDGVTVSSNITMTTGKGLMKIGVTLDSIKITQSTEGETDNKGVKQKIEFSRPGNQDAAFESFLENNVNEDLFAIVDYFNGTKKLFGYPGNPLSLTSESNDDNEKDTNTVTLESVLRGRRACFYTGTLPTVANAPSESSGSGSGSGSGGGA